MSSKTTISALLAAASLAAVLSACGPSIYRGGPYDNGPEDGRYGSRYGDLRGTVARVDVDGRRIYVNREDDRSLRNGGDYRGSSGQAVLYFDDRTRVDYQGRSYRPEELELGDQIAANVEESGGRLWARDIQVVYDVSAGGSPGQGDRYGSSSVHGVVRYVDTRNRTLEIERSRYNSNFSSGGSYGGSSDVTVVHFDAETVVTFQGRRYAPENLERGDAVDVQLRSRSGDSWLLAQEIVVVGQNQPVGR
jgi:hypothetical protein